MPIKEEVRILGVDDCPFTFEQKTSKIIGSVFRGGNYLEGIIIKDIDVDGFDSTEKIISMVKDSRHSKQIRVILLDGISFAGFNLADLSEISKNTGLGVIAVSRKMPNKEKLKSALKNIPNKEKRLEIVKKAGKVNIYEGKKGKIYFQNFGITEKDAEKVIKISARKSLIPEPIRTSHIIASALIKGESKGRV